MIFPQDIESKMKHYKILIVDDEPSICEMLQMILNEHENYEAITAENGEKALEILKNSGDIDVVLSDIQMPKLNGMEILREIKAMDPTIPVIMITGFPTIDVAIRCMKEGASDFITKPFKFDQIELILSRIIHERALLLENAKLKDVLVQTKEFEILNRKLSEKIKELTIMYAISESLSGTFSTVDNILEKSLEITAKSLDCERVSILFLDRPTMSLYIRVAKGLDNEIIHNTRIPVGEGISGKVFEHGKSLLIKDAGQELGPDLRDKWYYRTKSLVSVPLFIQNKPFGVINTTDKIAEIPFSTDDLFLLETIAKKVSLNIENIVLYESVYDNLLETLMALVKTLEAKDPYTQKHSERVTIYAMETAGKMGCNDEEIETLKFASYLHDIGKVGVRDVVLLKKGKLTNDEFEEIKRHPVIGESIVQHLELLSEEKAIIRSHHERWDGKGYPDGLKEKQIPFLARIITVADAYDAMTSSRPYRDEMLHEAAMKELFRNKWAQFDGDIVDAFSTIIEDLKGKIEGMGEGLISFKNNTTSL